MDKQEYCDHPEKLIGFSEFQGMGKGDGEAVEPDWLIENRINDLFEGERHDLASNQ